MSQPRSANGSLNGVLSSVNRGNIAILRGEFIAQLRNDNNGLESTIGRQGFGLMSENGELFTSFCRNHDWMLSLPSLMNS